MPNLISSVLPPLNLLTDKNIDHVPIQYDKIISLIRNLNPNKATGSDGVSGQMLLLWQLRGLTTANNISKYSGKFYLPRHVETC